MQYKINHHSEPSEALLLFLTQEILIDSQVKGKNGLYEKYATSFTNNSEEVIAGCSGFIFYGSLHIDKIWVIKPLRKLGIGKKLIREVEKLAKEKGCSFITVNTMDWQAPGFYEKLGFTKEFTRTGYQDGSSLIWYRKNL